MGARGSAEDISQAMGLITGGGKSAAAARPHRTNKSQLISSIGNLSVQYNFSCLGIAVACMTSYRGEVLDKADALKGDFPEPSWAANALLGTVFAGAVCGMIGMGYVGDRVGRRVGMMITLGFVVFGALASALLTWGSPATIYGVLALCRFILGFGVGGIYPLAAATAHEGSGKEGDASGNESRVGWAFFWQSPGAMLPYVFALPLLQLPAESWTTSVQFRLLLGTGALVAAIPLLATCYSDPEVHAVSASDENEDAASAAEMVGVVEHAAAAQVVSVSAAATDSAADAEAAGDNAPVLRSKKAVAASPCAYDDEVPPVSHWWTLLGTGGTWLIYDIIYYATNVFTPSILISIFGEGDTLTALAWQSIVVTAMGIPGSASSIMMLRGFGARWLSIWGFVLISVTFTALASAFTVSPDGMADLKFFLFCCVTFSLNFGPNVSTYVLPASAFPPDVRGTFHGLSAAAGKVGAVIGAFAYPVLKAQYGVAPVLWMQVFIGILGAALSVVILKPSRRVDTAPARRGTCKAWVQWVC